MPLLNVHITATNQEISNDTLSLDVAFELTLEDLKAYINAETGLDPARQRFFIDGRPLSGDKTTLQQLGLKEGDLLAVLILENEGQAPRGGGTQATASADPEAEALRQQILSNPEILSQQPPHIRQALNDPTRWGAIYQQLRTQQQERQSQMALMNEDPFDIDAQRRIEEAIRQQNVEDNLQHAFQYNPELFGSVTMLYIPVKVNGNPIKVLVDSGAQMTVMSPSCAEACGIMRLIDRRYSGIARGVGTAKILGRVHSADINIAGNFLPCSFTVMEGKAVDLLFGLDMLKRFQVNIDLKRNKLVFPDFDIDFLPESEIPKMQEEERQAEPTIPGPDGTEIGTESGVIRPAGSIPKPSAAGDTKHSLANAQPNFVPTSGASTSGASGPGASGTAPSASGASTSTSGAPAPAGRHSQEKIDQLVALGFSPEEARNALDACDGNVDAAASMMFS